MLLLDAGDQFQGTLFYNRWRGEGAWRAMNHLRYDAMVVGNLLRARSPVAPRLEGRVVRID